MKDLKNFINEAKKSFTLTDSERNELIEVVGFATGNIGDVSDTDQYLDFHKECSMSELDTLNDLYNVLDNSETYPRITNRVIDADEIKLLCKLLQYALDEDIVDLSEILEKIS